MEEGEGERKETKGGKEKKIKCSFTWSRETKKGEDNRSKGFTLEITRRLHMSRDYSVNV